MTHATLTNHPTTGHPAPPATASLKILVTGGTGVGKTAFIRATSDITVLSTDEPHTDRGASTVAGAGTCPPVTTVACDFGRTDLHHDRRTLRLCLFGTPGQERFAFLWDPLAVGAHAAVLLLDTRSPHDCLHTLGRLEQRGLPYVVAVNTFHGAPGHTSQQIRDGLRLPDSIPVTACDARDPASATAVLALLTGPLPPVCDQR